MTLYIVNPISGHGNKNPIINRLTSSGCKVIFSEFAGHAEMIAREAEEKTIVAVGGDGTVNEVARGIIDTDKTLGIIPCGSGDGLALHLGISHDPRKALKTIESGRIRTLDAGKINDRYFFSVCGTGLDAIVSEKFAKSGKRGLANYIEQAIVTWRNHTVGQYLIDIDGRKMEHDAVMVTIGNSDQWGNGARVTPLADSSDGILDITVVEDFKNIEIPMLAYRLMTGTVNMAHNIHCYKGKHITISRKQPGPAHADGDWFDAGENLDIQVIPHAIQVIVP